MKTLKRLKKEKWCIIGRQQQIIKECMWDELQKNNDALEKVKEQILYYKQQDVLDSEFQETRKE
jgi:hypothetical protein